MIKVQISSNVFRYGSVCLLAGTLSWGQAANSSPVLPEPATTVAPNLITNPPVQSQRGAMGGVASDVPVITISGLCDNPPTNRTGASNCETVVTRAGFEKLVNAVQPNMSARARREFAIRYANALVMARKAEQIGLDKAPSFEEQMKVARVEILSQEMSRKIQVEASQISDKEIAEFYKDNSSSFEQAEVDRVYIPKTRETVAAPAKASDDEQQPSQSAEQVMKDLADQLHARAMAGEDFSELQTEAYKIAGISASPNSNLGKIRRISLPPSQAWVMDLKPGEISSVIVGPNAYFIYKIRTKEMLPLDQAREEIKESLRSRRIQDEKRLIEESATPSLNEAYFYHPRGSQVPIQAAK